MTRKGNSVRVEYVTVEIEHEVATSALDWDWPAVEFAGLHGLIHRVRVLGAVEHEPTVVSDEAEARALPLASVIRDKDGNKFIKADDSDMPFISTSDSSASTSLWPTLNTLAYPLTVLYSP